MKDIKEFLLHKFFGIGGSGGIEPVKDEVNRKYQADQEIEYNKKLQENKNLETKPKQ